MWFLGLDLFSSLVIYVSDITISDPLSLFLFPQGSENLRVIMCLRKRLVGGSIGRGEGGVGWMGENTLT